MYAEERKANQIDELKKENEKLTRLVGRLVEIIGDRNSEIKSLRIMIEETLTKIEELEGSQ